MIYKKNFHLQILYKIAIILLVLPQFNSLAFNKTPTEHYFKSYSGLHIFALEDFYNKIENDIYLKKNRHNDDKKIEFLKILLKADLFFLEQELNRFLEVDKSIILKDIEFLMIGNKLFDSEKYSKALEKYSIIDLYNIGIDNLDDVNFKSAYCFIENKNYEKAQELFNKITNETTKHKDAAYYYAGYLATVAKQYTQSIETLNKIIPNSEYKRHATSLIAQNYYEMSDFKNLTDYLEGQLIDIEEETSVELKNQFNKLYAESYYFNHRYQESIPYYEKILEIDKETQLVLYRLAYSNYMLDEYDNALKIFKEIQLEKSSVISQLACYYTGTIYAIKKDYQMALATLEFARNQNNHKAISEKAALEFAKINFTLKNYDASLEALMYYKKNYPLKHSEYINALLKQCYANIKDYSVAIKYLEQQNVLDQKDKEYYQLITFEKAKEDFNNQNYEESSIFLTKSLNFCENKTIYLYTNFLRALISYSKEDYSSALKILEDIINTQIDHKTKTYAQYCLGYIHYNKKMYDEVIKNLEPLMGDKKVSENFIDDAMLRLADAKFATKKHKEAIELYKKHNRANINHSNYYQGLAYVAINEFKNAHTHFEFLIKNAKNTTWATKAMEKNISVFLAEEDYAQASINADIYIKDVNDKKYRELIQLYKATALVGLNREIETLEIYKELFANSNDEYIVENAAIGIRKVLSNANKLKELKEFMNEYNQKSTNKNLKEDFYLATAKELFYKENYNDVIDTLNPIIAHRDLKDTNANSIYILMADSFYAINNFEESLTFYNRVNESTLNNNTRLKILLRKANAYYNLSNYSEAKKCYEKALNISETKKQRINILEKICLVLLETSDYQSLIFFGNELLKESTPRSKSSLDASIYVIIAHIETKNYKAAKDIISTIDMKLEIDAIAEIKYLLAKIYYLEGCHKESLEVLYEINRTHFKLEENKAKSFILIADNLIAQKDDFQATATLNSIIENSKSNKYVEIAKNRLKALKSKNDKPTAKKYNTVKTKSRSKNQIR